MKGKRSNVDFSEHVFNVISKSDNHYIFKFAKPQTNTYSITFVNACGILAVTGDCGNWIFCREFYPSADGYVSDSYWIEKAKIYSTQNPLVFDHGETKGEIDELLNGNDCEINKDEARYLADIRDHVDEGEMRYLIYAHDNLPAGRDHDFIPIAKALDVGLAVIFDAFDEICRRIKDEQAKG